MSDFLSVVVPSDDVVQETVIVAYDSSDESRKATRRANAIKSPRRKKRTFHCPQTEAELVDTDEDSPRCKDKEEALNRMLTKTIAQRERLGPKRERRQATRIDYSEQMQRSKSFGDEHSARARGGYEDRSSSSSEHESDDESEGEDEEEDEDGVEEEEEEDPPPPPAKLPAAPASWRWKSRPPAASMMEQLAPSASALPPKKRARSPAEDEDVVDAVKRRAREVICGARAW